MKLTLNFPKIFYKYYAIQVPINERIKSINSMSW